MALDDLIGSIYYLLIDDVHSEYGKLLESVAAPDPCDMLGAESDEKSATWDQYQSDICKARRLTSVSELNLWLVGLFDGRFWKEGWQPDGY